MILDKYKKCPRCGALAVTPEEQPTAGLHCESVLYRCSNTTDFIINGKYAENFTNADCYKNLKRLKMTTDLIEEIIEVKDKVLVKFGASWCAPCNMMKPVLKQVEAEGITVIDIDSEEYPELMKEYNVSSLPTMFFYKDGKLVNTLTGAMPKVSVLKAFD
jgi:thioredoxin 1